MAHLSEHVASHVHCEHHICSCNQHPVQPQKWPARGGETRGFRSSHSKQAHILSVHVLPAAAGIVLLKNERRALPLDLARLRRVVLVGPHANASEHMLGNYYGRPSRIVTPLQAFQARMSMHDGAAGLPGAHVHA